MMPKAPITNDFAFGSGGESLKHHNEDPEWAEIDMDMSNADTFIRPDAGPNYTTYVKADTPNQERRRMIVRATLFSIIFVPSIVFAFPPAESYVLLGIMAFTFATNFAITLMSANLEDKATSLESKTDTLLDELNSAASTLRNFQKSLESIDLEQLKENVGNARSDLEPLMERLSNPSLTRIVATVEQLMDYAEDVDFEKLDRMFKTYKKDADNTPYVAQVVETQTWFEEDDVDPLDDDFFPSEQEEISWDEDEFLP